MENTIKISLPDDVYNQLADTITRTVEKCLNERMSKINAAPVLRSRDETKAILQVTLPTLRNYEIQGKLMPKRSGRRVLYDQRDIDAFLNSNRGRN